LNPSPNSVAHLPPVAPAAPAIGREIGLSGGRIAAVANYTVLGDEGTDNLCQLLVQRRCSRVAGAFRYGQRGSRENARSETRE